MRSAITISMLPLAALLMGAGEIVVTGEKPRELQARMVKAENEFFALYNKLNTDRQYDMVCQKERRAGSNFDERTCQPRYVLTAREVAATEQMQAAVSSVESSGPANTRGPNVGNRVSPGAPAELASREQAFRQNLLGVLQKSPELQALGKHRDELQLRYDAATRGPEVQKAP